MFEPLKHFGDYDHTQKFTYVLSAFNFDPEAPMILSDLSKKVFRYPVFKEQFIIR
jgi:hypothetical protein